MLTLSKAQSILSGAISKAQELNINVTVVVVDNHGNLIASSRMDGAIAVSPKFAFAKAYTAGTIGLPTAGIAQYADPGKPYYGVNSLDGGVFTTIAGGLPIKEGDTLVGGVGVGGSYDVTQDAACAEAGLAAL